MNTEQTVTKIMAALFEIPEEQITPESGIGDFPKWDSLGHINLLQEIQDELDVEFEPEEIIELENVEDIVGLAIRKENEK